MESVNISKEMFSPYRPPTSEEDARHEPVRGYFADAVRRLGEHRSCIISALIIVLIALFSLVAPILIPREDSVMDPYYAKLPPRLSVGGILRGTISRRLGEVGLTSLAAIAAGSIGVDGISVTEAVESEYSPIISVGDAEGRVYPVKVDGYLEVGFVYKIVEPEEYARMLEWQSSEGRQLLFPLIAYNEYCSDRLDANAWYKADGDGMALKIVGDGYERAALSSDLCFVDNYLRDADGNLVYAAPSGGGEALRVRVLYYNYYIYQNGAAPDYIFGTDSRGYDLALRVAGGIRVSLLLAVAISVINLIIGALVGAVEGYYGGAVDLAIERVTDILSGVPFIVVATLFQIYLGDRVGAIPSLLFAFVLTGWLGTASRVRAQFYRYKNSEYVLAARSMGVKDGRIMWRHIFPNTLGTLITASALTIPGVIFTESMLSFLGIVNLGAEGISSLGTLMSDASGIWINYPHLMIAPALVISLLMISFNLLGNGLREAFNPGMKGGV